MKSVSKVTSAALVLLSSVSNSFGATHSGISLNWKYQIAETGQVVQGGSSAQVPSLSRAKLAQADIALQKSVYLVRLANLAKGQMKAYAETCKAPEVLPTPEPSLLPLPLPLPFPFPTTGPAPITGPASLPGSGDIIAEPLEFKCLAEGALAADTLLAGIQSLSLELNLASFTKSSDAKIHEATDLFRKLAANMREGKLPYSGGWLEGIRAFPTAIGGAPKLAGLNVTGGGAQDIDFVRKQINDGFVPDAESLPIEGFLSEFDLASESMAGCQQLLCVAPIVGVDSANKKLYVQAAMGSNVTKESFKRAPQNLSIVLDISGSMGATDGTEKNRVEWAKDAIAKTIENLNAGDTVSIVLFDDKMEVLQDTVAVTDKAAILAKLVPLAPRGSTNVDIGLRMGFELASLNKKDGVENRVILISDAGVNTGVTDTASFTKLIGDYAAEGINLTAIGLGLNFNEELIRAITMSRGGNYVFVQSGLKMFRYFENFDYLVTPVAYDFKATLELDGPEFEGAKLVKAYGVPAKEGEPVRDLLDVRTLFFSEEGGAIVLEYDLA
jgi:hypothetical protein